MICVIQRGTICKASETLMEHGAKDIRILVTHGVLSGPAIVRLAKRPEIIQVLVTNSIPQDTNVKNLPKICQIDVSKLLADTAQCLFTGDSISALFS